MPKEIDFKEPNSAELLTQAAININHAMTWGTTPEGDVFWREIHDKLHKLAVIAERRGFVSKKNITTTENNSIPVKETVHIFYNGGSLCKLPAETWSWPKGHTRVSLKDYKHSNCSTCLDGITSDMLNIIDEQMETSK